MSACPICSADPCVNPSFCEACHEADARLRAERRNRPTKLFPQDWDRMSIDGLWHVLHDERKWPTPQTTIEAVMRCFRERGPQALHEPANIERLSRCDDAAIAEIDARIKKLEANYALAR